MLKKELLDTIKILAQCLLLLFIIPIARVMGWQVFHRQWEISGIFQPVYIAIVIIFAAYSGVTLFQAEKKNRAIEYLLSLPLSRWKMITSKILPRLAALVLLIAVGFMLSVLKEGAADTISLLILFASALFLSLAVESVLTGLMGVFIINVILYYSSLITSYLTMTHQWFGSEVPIFFLSQILPALSLLIPLAAAFILTLKNFDAKPLKWQAKPYIFIALPVVFGFLIYILRYLKQYLQWIEPLFR